MPQDNIFTPFSMTTSAIVGALPATISGGVIGAKQASNAMSRSFGAFSERSGQADSLLAGLNALFDDKNDEVKDISGLNLFPQVKESLEVVAQAIAWVGSKASVAPFSLVTHAAQLPVDFSQALNGILNSVKDSDNFLHPEASTFENEQPSGFFAHTRALTKEIADIQNHLQQKVENAFGDGNFDVSHRGVATVSANAMMSASMTVSGVLALGVDTVGALFRETGGITHFAKVESKSEGEENIYQAWSECVKVFSESQGCEASLLSLQKLESAIFDFEEACQLLSEQGAALPSVSVLTRLLISGQFVTALRAFNSESLALRAACNAEDKVLLSENSKVIISKASSTRELQGGGLHHSQNLTDLSANFDKVIAQLDNELQFIKKDRDHQSVRVSATSHARLSSALTAVPFLVTDFSGIIARELSGTVDFTSNDKGTEAESKQVSNSGDESGADLDALMQRVSQMQERIARCKALGVSAPAILGVTHVVSCGALIATLNSVAGVCFALREIRTLSENDPVPTRLDAEEQKQADEYKAKVIASNQRVADATGSGSVSQHVALHSGLQSIMNKIVLTHRSKLNFLQPGMERNDLNSVGKSLIAFSQGNSSGFTSGALGVLALVSLEAGISTEAFIRALSGSLQQCDRIQDGVDKIKTGESSQFNFSSASNATRLSADEVKSSGLKTLLQTTYITAESVASRTLVLSLCHSGVLRQALQELYAEARAGLVEHPQFLNSSLVSVAVMDKLADKIVGVLDRIEEGHRQIPGLNHDMASQLASRTKANIITALSSHSLFIMPFLHATHAIKEAKVIDEHKRDEALSDTVGRSISVALNTIQAFSENCGDLDGVNEPVLGQHNSTMQSHLRSNRSVETSSVAMCCIALLCDELLEISISRSLTLLDKQRLIDTSVQNNQVTKVEAKDSSAKTGEDSESGHVQSVTRAITALRLTLTHLGQSLGRLANDFKDRMQANSDKFVQNDLLMHSSQRRFLSCMSSCLSQSSVSLMKLSAVLSKLPLTSAGCADGLRRLIHSMDQELEFKRVHSSANSTRDGSSESYIVTGILTDSTMDMLLSLTKVLLRSSLLGLDTSLSIAKVLEILTLHQRPEEALSLEIRGLSKPNGTLQETKTMSDRTYVATMVGTGSALAETNAGDASSDSTEDAVRHMQQVVDEAIDDCSMLQDDEKDRLTLRVFYEVLIRVLIAHEQPREQPADNHIQDVVNRFDRGGFALSSYHSSHGGVPGNRHVGNVIRNPLLEKEQFFKCDDAQALLNTFIFKAARDEIGDKLEGQNSLLRKLKIAFEARDLQPSTQTQSLWKYIIEQVASRVYMADQRSTVLTSRYAHRLPFNRKAFLEEMLRSGQAVEPAVPVVIHEEQEEKDLNPEVEGMAGVLAAPGGAGIHRPEDPLPEVEGLQHDGALPQERPENAMPEEQVNPSLRR